MPAVTNNRNQWLNSQLTDRYDQPPTQTHAIQARSPDTEPGPLRQVSPSLRRQSQTTSHSTQQRANRDQSALTVNVAECQVVDLCRWCHRCRDQSVLSARGRPRGRCSSQLGPARIEERIAAYRRRATAAALAVQFQRTTSPRYSSGKNRLKELGVSEGHIASPSLTERSRRMPDAWSRTCPSGAI